MTHRFTKRQLLAGPLGGAAVTARRASLVANHHARALGQSIRWLVRSREYTNFTYPLSELNRTQLAWWVADAVDQPVARVTEYFDELESDQRLRDDIADRTRAGAWARYSDTDVYYGRRLGWYALVRAVRPALVVETGTEKGLGSLVVAAALLRNRTGRLVTIDVHSDTGFLIQEPYSAVVDRRIGDSLNVLAGLNMSVDMFIHDSLHTREHELSEYRTVERWLSPNALVLSDNAHATDALPSWAEASGRRFSYFQETPERHWYRGAGIGLARPPHGSARQ